MTSQEKIDAKIARLKADAKALDGARSKATPGSWGADGHGIYSETGEMMWSDVETNENANFIALSRNRPAGIETAMVNLVEAAEAVSESWSESKNPDWSMADSVASIREALAAVLALVGDK